MTTVNIITHVVEFRKQDITWTEVLKYIDV